MISKQQRRLLFLFILAFGLLTVPVILVLIYLVPSNEVSTRSDKVIQDTVSVSIAENNLLASESNLITNAGNKTISNQTDNDQVTTSTDRSNENAMTRAFIAGNWVVVDCGKRIILQCPHRLLNTATSPRFGRSNQVFQSHCRDVSIKLDSFCNL